MKVIISSLIIILIFYTNFPFINSFDNFRKGKDKKSNEEVSEEIEIKENKNNVEVLKQNTPSGENKLKTTPLKIMKRSSKAPDASSRCKRLSSESKTSTKFYDVLNEIRSLKIELFGNPEENMDFFKRNRKAYDTRLIQRATKIAKVLELEELLDFYQSNTKKFKEKE